MSAPTVNPSGLSPDDGPLDPFVDQTPTGPIPVVGAGGWRGAPSRTVVVPPVREQQPARRRTISNFRRSDYLAIAGALAAALALTSVAFTTVLPFSGLLGFVVVTYVLFLGLYALVVSFDESGPAVRDRLAMVFVQSLASLLLLALVFVITYTLVRGWQALLQSNFYTQDLSNAGPLDPLDVGGIAHAVVGTLIMIGIALAITIPLGVTCAVFLTEIPGAFSRFVRTIVEAMTALPSIIAGLFIYATFILILGFDKSGFAAALAISVMMLPIIIRAADVVLRLVPGSLKEASYAMGAGQWRTVWHVTLPTARSGLATAVILGTARGIGETSPVLLTAGFTAALNVNPFSGPMVSLPLATFELVKSPEQSFIARGFGTAAVLMALVLVLFVIARLIGGRGAGTLSSRALARRMRRSSRDAARFDARVAARAAATMPPVAAADAVIDLRTPSPTSPPHREIQGA